jgi:hypothetical protein
MSVEGCSNLFQDENGVIFPPLDPAEVKRAEEQAARTAEWEAAAQRRAQEIDALCDRLDAAMEPYLREHLAAVNEGARVSAAARKDFEAFKAYCAKYDPPLPHLPARPQAIAAFLVREMSHGSAHANRLVKNISTVHRAVGFSDPATDVLVQAVLRAIKQQLKEPITNANS